VIFTDITAIDRQKDLAEGKKVAQLDEPEEDRVLNAENTDVLA